MAANSQAFTVAYLGPPGTFGEEAALLAVQDAVQLPCPSHTSVAAKVDAGEADIGILAIANLITGSVAETLDILVDETSLSIQKEILLRIEHNLIAKTRLELSEIELVYSHPQALAQCRHFLEENGLSAFIEPALSTTHAVELVMNSQLKAGAIANYRAATRYGGEVLASSIQDTSNNVTRFIVLGDKETSPSGDDRTSIALWFDADRPGLLTAVLTEFSSRGINCMKLESRPTRANLGEYVFLIDFEGHIQEERCSKALTEISKLASRIKIFGSYPKGTLGD